ncbi:Cof-type HAD-IIB family hydrolase [Companilactobacillus zhongbaensis]|uniref:Cof-type HAD-IIB family hydrolase n=1 Tax=Companilactobacillus zhongbaensis TaxID=2486009 RepID=UPI000F767952|nr:Cof-type HAD-IIB family hydrolase [Companilactobacillus zhongbaensis]
MKKYKGIVFFDLDGTLFNDDKQVSDRNLLALDLLRENDILPVIATGRNEFEIENLIKKAKFDSFITANGSYVVFENKPIVVEEIPTKVNEELLAFASHYNEEVAFYNNKECAVSADSPMVDDNYKALGLEKIIDPDFYKNNQINFSFVYTPEGKNDHQDKYEEIFGSQLTFYRNNPRGLDVVLKGVSKAGGITSLIEEADLQGIPTYAFGDGNNDIPMFKKVDNPIAMINGLSVAKENAKFITKEDNNHSGIYYELRELRLI